MASKRLVAGLTRLAEVCTGFIAACGVASAVAGESEIREALKPSLPDGGTVSEIRPAPVPGLFEVRINADEIVYTDGSGRYLFQGSLFDTQKRVNLTRERIEALHPLPLAKAPLQDAIATTRGTGARKLLLFADPNCEYCKRLETALQAVDNVTVYTFLIPVLGADSQAKARRIWCAPDRAKAWDDWMLRGVAPSAEVDCADASVLQRNIALARAHKISGTPTLFFEDGSRMVGPVSAAAIEARLGSIAKK